MKRVVFGKLYDTDTASLVASDQYWDGHNLDRGGRNCFLYKTKKGNFFVHRTTLWQGELDKIEPVTPAEARDLYEELPVHCMSWEEAFGEAPEEA